MKTKKILHLNICSKLVCLLICINILVLNNCAGFPDSWVNDGEKIMDDAFPETEKAFNEYETAESESEKKRAQNNWLVGVGKWLFGGTVKVIGLMAGGKSTRANNPSPAVADTSSNQQSISTSDSINIIEENDTSSDFIISVAEIPTDPSPVSNWWDLFMETPSVTSSITQTGSEQNISNPQVSPVVDTYRLPPRTNTQGSRAGRADAGPGYGQRQQVTGRNNQSANPNAGNAGSRAQGAEGSLSYTQPQQQITSRQDTPVGTNTVPVTPSPNPVRSATTPTPPPQVKQETTIIAQSPQVQADTIVKFIEPRPSYNQITNSSVSSNQQSNITTVPVRQNTGGIKYKDSTVEQSCLTLSSTGREILATVEEVARELNVTIIITDGDRPWEEQLYYILTRQDSYRGINGRFETRFNNKPPNSISQLTLEQREWYYNEIIRQAGTGFAHVGGSAVDIRVSDFSSNGKRRLEELLSAKGVKILYEIPPRYNSPDNPISRNESTVFHLSK